MYAKQMLCTSHRARRYAFVVAPFAYGYVSNPLTKLEIQMSIRAITHGALILGMAVAGCATDVTDTSASEHGTDIDEHVGEVGAAFSVAGEYTYDLGRYGGTGGTPSTLRCRDESDVIVGFHGRFANVIDRLGLVCARLRADGTLGVRYTTSSVGGQGGAPFLLECPAGKVATGLGVRAATYVDALDLSCGGPPFTANVALNQWIGGDGGQLVVRSCPDNYVLRTIDVSTGNVVDAVRGRCVYVGTR
jgi:hypothetical protein